MNYDAIDIADLKELFEDGNRSLGSNFSTLIDYFGSNAVKDNGDGTIEVNGKSVDITNIADFTPSDYAILSVDANFTGGLQSNGVDVATDTDINTLTTDLSTGLATKVSTTDTVDWQKTKITADSGVPSISIYTDSIYTTMSKVTPGFYSTYISGSPSDNPFGGPLKGYMFCDENSYVIFSGTLELTGQSVEIVYDGGSFYHYIAPLAADIVHTTGAETIAGNKTFTGTVDVDSTLLVKGASTFSIQPTNGTQVYPIYATSDNDTDAQTLISSLQASGFSGLIGIPES